jgi:hypothetical protein
LIHQETGAPRGRKRLLPALTERPLRQPFIVIGLQSPPRLTFDRVLARSGFDEQDPGRTQIHAQSPMAQDNAERHRRVQGAESGLLSAHDYQLLAAAG